MRFCLGVMVRINVRPSLNGAQPFSAECMMDFHRSTVVFDVVAPAAGLPGAQPGCTYVACGGSDAKPQPVGPTGEPLGCVRVVDGSRSAGAAVSCGVAAAARIGAVDDSTSVVVVGVAAALADEGGPDDNAADGSGGMGALPSIGGACEDASAAPAACAPLGEPLGCARAANGCGAAGAVVSCGVAAAARIGAVDDSTLVVVVGAAAALAHEGGLDDNAADGSGGMGALPSIGGACEDASAAPAACAPLGEPLGCARAANGCGAAGAVVSCGVAAAARIGAVDDSTLVVVVGAAAALADEGWPSGNAVDGSGGMGALPSIGGAGEDAYAAPAACAPPGEPLGKRAAADGSGCEQGVVSCG